MGEHLAGCCGDGGVICAVASLAGYVDWVAILEDVGAQPPLLVASAAGAGAVMRFLDRERGRRLTQLLCRLRNSGTSRSTFVSSGGGFRRQ